MPEKKTVPFYFNGMVFDCPETVYYPSEDSYFLAENVKVEKGAEAIDVGCGSGIQSVNVLMQGAAKATALDTSSEAIEATKANCTKAGFAKKITAKTSNLFEKCGEKADVIIFNPPYLESEGIIYTDLEGGKKGREVLDKFLEQFPVHLKEKGKCYFLQTDLNSAAETEKKLSLENIECRIIARKKGFFEELLVYECRTK